MRLNARAKTVIKVNGLNGGLADLTIPKGNDIIGAINSFLPLVGIDIEIKSSVIGGWVNRNDRYPEQIQGRKILGYGNGYAFECEYDDGVWSNIGGEEFTHWQELSPPPQA